jgi:hypothetical protein
MEYMCTPYKWTDYMYTTRSMVPSYYTACYLECILPFVLLQCCKAKQLKPVRDCRLQCYLYYIHWSIWNTPFTDYIRSMYLDSTVKPANSSYPWDQWKSSAICRDALFRGTYQKNSQIWSQTICCYYHRFGAIKRSAIHRFRCTLQAKLNACTSVCV